MKSNYIVLSYYISEYHWNYSVLSRVVLSEHKTSLHPYFSFFFLILDPAGGSNPTGSN